MITRTDETGHLAQGAAPAHQVYPIPTPAPGRRNPAQSPRTVAVLTLMRLSGSPGTALPLESSADWDASCTLASDTWGPLPSTGERVGPCLHLRPLAPLLLFLASFSLGPQASSSPPELPRWPTLASRQVLSPRTARAGHSRRFHLPRTPHTTFVLEKPFVGGTGCCDAEEYLRVNTQRTPPRGWIGVWVGRQDRAGEGGLGKEERVEVNGWRAITCLRM